VRVDGFILEFLFNEDDKHYIGNNGPFPGQFDCKTDNNNSPILLVKMKNFMMFSGASTDMQNVCQKPGKVMASSFSSNAVIFKCEGKNIYQDDVFPKTQCADAVIEENETVNDTANTTPTENTITNTDNTSTTDNTTTDNTATTDNTTSTDNTTTTNDTTTTDTTDPSARILQSQSFSSNPYAILLSLPFINMNYEYSQQVPKSMAKNNDLTIYKEFNKEFNCNDNCISCFRGQCFKCKIGYELVSLSFCQQFPSMIFNSLTREYEDYDAITPFFYGNSVLLPVSGDAFVNGYLILNFNLQFSDSFNFAPVKFFLQNRHFRTILSIPKVFFFTYF
jgi:hypothetical protein